MHGMVERCPTQQILFAVRHGDNKHHPGMLLILNPSPMHGVYACCTFPPTTVDMHVHSTLAVRHDSDPPPPAFTYRTNEQRNHKDARSRPPTLQATSSTKQDVSDSTLSPHVCGAMYVKSNTAESREWK